MTDSHKYLFHHNYFILFRCNLYYFSTLACDHLCQLQKSNNKDGKMFAEECLNSNFGVFVTFFLYYSSFFHTTNSNCSNNNTLQTPSYVIGLPCVTKKDMYLKQFDITGQTGQHL